MTLILPLDIEALFVNTFAGSMAIFIGIMVLVIAGLAATFRMNNLVFFASLVLFSTFMAPWAGWLYFLMLIFAGLIVFLSISKIVNR
jgi:hypothetical protein